MAGEEPDRKEWVTQQPCLLADNEFIRIFGKTGITFTACNPWPKPPGRVDGHHMGRKGMSQRAHDDTLTPLCHQHHMDWHALSGAFKLFDKLTRKLFQHSAIEYSRGKWRRHLEAIGC